MNDKIIIVFRVVEVKDIIIHEHENIRTALEEMERLKNDSKVLAADLKIVAVTTLEGFARG